MLRVRTAAYEVPAEQPMLRGLRFWPPAIACIVGVFALAALDLWLSETTEPKAIRYFTPLLILTAVVFVWTTGWSVSRASSPVARVSACISSSSRRACSRYSIYDQAAEIGAFALSWTRARDDVVYRRVASARRDRASRISLVDQSRAPAAEA